MNAVAVEEKNDVDKAVADLQPILPEEQTLKVAGLDAKVRRINSREFLLLMRILTNGLGDGITKVKLTMDDPEEMKGELIAILLLAVPNAITETGEFLLAIVEAEHGKDAAAVAVAMQNPPIETMLDVLGIVIEQEKDELSSLAGKAQAWMSRLKKGMTGPTG